MESERKTRRERIDPRLRASGWDIVPCDSPRLLDGVSQSNINGTKLGAMPLPLPPIEEQREIVRRASQMLARADTLLAHIDATTRRLNLSSQAVLAKAFRGELVSGGGALR